MRKHKRFLGLLAAVAVFASACGGTGASTAPGTASAAPASGAPSAAASEAAPSVASGTLPTPEKTTIKIGLSVTETSQFAAKLAEMAGIYKKNGLTVEVTVFEGDGKVMQALQAGQLDVGFGGTSSFITSQGTDVPVVGLAVNAVVLTDLLTSTKDVKTAEDLKGKCVAVSTFGGTSHGAVILSLKALNLTPADVVITEVGGQSARIAALQGGSCAAAPVDASRRAEMEGLGFNFLVDLKAEKLPWGRSGLGVTEDWLKANPNTATVVAASVLEAQNLMWTDPDTAAAKYAEFTQSDVESAKKLIVEFQDTGNRQMMWDDAAFQNPKDVLVTVNPDIANIPVTDAFDRSVLDGLKASGYYDFLGIPAN
jgi:ABC-type nitrate/sulfonate/bicarbonate transport system substrate-binding protein